MHQFSNRLTSSGAGPKLGRVSRTVCVRGLFLVGLVASSSGCLLDRSGTRPAVGPDAGLDAGADAMVGPRCGDGRLDPGERCDGIELAGMTCTSRGFSTGNLLCSESCEFDESLCDTPCGNGVIDSGEACDGSELGGQGCGDLGSLTGTLACAPDCQFDTSACVGCGNGVVEAGEECDGDDLGGLTCAGGLACDPSCLLDTTACTYPSAGDGRDGDLTIEEPTRFGGTQGAVAFEVQSIEASGVTLPSNPRGLATDDEVLLINVQGSSSACGSVGRYELARVAGVSGRRVTFTAPIVNTYGVGDSNADLTGQVIVLQRVPSYGVVDIRDDGRLGPAVFDGRIGGIMAFRARELRVAPRGLLTVGGRGFQGGRGWTTNTSHDGRRGASICGDPQNDSPRPNDGGGGGGAYVFDADADDGCGQGGGGGGYGAMGRAEAFVAACQRIDVTMSAANGGGTYGAPDLSDRLYFGSGGGAGATDEVEGSSGSGGRGGGILLVWAGRATIDGRASASGATGLAAAGLYDPGNGGGGSGGSVLLRAGALEGSGSLNAFGGPGAASASDWNSAGGRGGVGRLHVDYFTVNGQRFGTSGAATRLAERSMPEVGYSARFLD